MTHQRTTEQLDNMLSEEGFSPYPSMPNKYWDANGRIIWTDGSYYQTDRGSAWQKYDGNDWPAERLDT